MIEQDNCQQIEENMNKIMLRMIFFILFFLSGCNTDTYLSSLSRINSDKIADCPLQPPAELVLRDVRDIVLKSSLEKN